MVVYLYNPEAVRSTVLIRIVATAGVWIQIEDGSYSRVAFINEQSAPLPPPHPPLSLINDGDSSHS